MVTTRGIGIQKRKWGRLGFLSHATDGKQGNISRQTGLWGELSVICLEEVGNRGTVGGVSIKSGSSESDHHLRKSKSHGNTNHRAVAHALLLELVLEHLGLLCPLSGFR